MYLLSCLLSGSRFPAAPRLPLSLSHHLLVLRPREFCSSSTFVLTAMLRIGDSTGWYWRAAGSLAAPAELPGESSSVCGVQLRDDIDAGLSVVPCEPNEFVRKPLLGPTRGLYSPISTQRRGWRACFAGSGLHRSRVRSRMSLAVIELNASAYLFRRIRDSMTMYSANSCRRSRSEEAMRSFSAKVW